MFSVYLKDNNKNFSKGFGRIWKWFIKLTVALTRKFKILRRLIIFIEHAFFSPRYHAEVFKKYNPDILLVPSLGTFDYDQYLMREARKNGVKVVSVVILSINVKNLFEERSNEPLIKLAHP